MFECPVAHLFDKADFLCNRDEEARADHSAFGVIPAHQRLKALQLVRVCVKDRLVMQFEFTLHDRITQVFFDLALASRAVGQFGRIEAVAAPAMCLGIVQCQVCGFHELVDFEAIIRRGRKAYRSPDDRTRTVHRIGLGKELDDLIAIFAQLSAIVDLWQDNDKFIAAQTAYFAAMRENALQSAGCLHKQFVTRLVTERVIDVLEPVEPDNDERAGKLGVAEIAQDGRKT